MGKRARQATHGQIRHETRVCNQTFEIADECENWKQDVKHKMR